MATVNRRICRALQIGLQKKKHYTGKGFLFVFRYTPVFQCIADGHSKRVKLLYTQYGEKTKSLPWPGAKDLYFGKLSLMFNK